MRRHVSSKRPSCARSSVVVGRRRTGVVAHLGDHRSLARLRDRLVDGDPGRPRRERGVAAKPREVLVDREPGLLEHVLGVLVRVHDGARRAIQALVVAPHEQLEVGAATRAHRVDEVAVAAHELGGFGGHTHQRSTGVGALHQIVVNRSWLQNDPSSVPETVCWPSLAVIDPAISPGALSNGFVNDVIVSVPATVKEASSMRVTVTP